MAEKPSKTFVTVLVVDRL